MNVHAASAGATHRDGSNSPIIARYRERTPGSARLAEAARSVMPSGITHDARFVSPYAIYTDRASGARKWDVDGNAYIDYFGGHGAHLLGHGPAAVLAAAHEALDKGTQFGTNHALEVEWARAIQRMVPSAERVRFTASGTEATLMALRLARSFTGRTRMARFATHFHGWHDHMTSGYTSHFDGSPTPGVLSEIAHAAVLLRPDDPDGIAAALAGRDVAAVIVEPTGGSFGKVPLDPKILTVLREVTARTGTILVFDEVVTGFRVAPGGAQAAFGVTPDMTTLAKIVAGGMPGGVVAGRADILAGLDFEAAAAAGREKIEHPGTFNANPVSAAAGIAALRIIETTDACARANAYGERLRTAMNAILREKDVPWSVYGTFSGFHIFTNAAGLDIKPGEFDPFSVPFETLKRGQSNLNNKLRLAFLNHGVDIGPWPGGLISSAHDEDDLTATLGAFSGVLDALRAEGEI